MPAQKIHTAEDEYGCSLKLLEVLQEMAAQDTNAVLQVLAEVDQLKTECRYPEEGLLFAGNRWRAFYHCHDAASKHEDEHGHFHLFTDLGDQAWAHVAGLSIGNQGQPLQWFAVNRWVTDGPWLECDDLFEQMKYLTEEDELAINWLTVLIQLYRLPLAGLLGTRDEQIKTGLKERDREAILDDRDIYTLATLAIDLQAELETHLLGNPETVPESVKKEQARHEV